MRFVLPIAVSVGVLVLDQATKRFFETTLAESARTVPVMPYFNLVLSHNRGMSFGLFSSEHTYTPYVLALVALSIVTGLVVWLWRSDSAIERLGLSAILGGAVGNVVDRLEDGAVTDFLDVYLGAYHWPAFNIADAAITCGVAVLLFEAVWPRSKVARPHTVDDEE